MPLRSHRLGSTARTLLPQLLIFTIAKGFGDRRLAQNGVVTDWDEVLGHDFLVPPGRPVAELAGELLTMLESPDPKIRDDTAYLVLAIWTGRGVLDGHLAGIGDGLAGRLAGPIYQRTFAAISLAGVVLRDAGTGELDDGRVLGWLDTFTSWWRQETDLRGWDPQHGWLHAAAHGADALRAFGRSPRLAAPQLRDLLDLAADRLLADRGYLFAHGEDDRIAYALASVLTRAELPASAAASWLGRLHDAIADGTPGPVPPWAANTLRTLASLYIFADRGVAWYDPQTDAFAPPVRLPHVAELKDQIAAVLRLPWRGLG